MRAPQHDLGEVVYDTMQLETLRLYDDKEFYIQLKQPEKLTLYEPALRDASQGLYLLTREWDADTWQFGPLHEF